MKLKDKIKSLTDRVKSAWNYVKPIVKSPYTYFSLTIFASGGFAQAQSNPMDAHLHGKVRSGQTAQGLPGVEVKYKQLTPTVDSITTYTNQYGEYNFTITGNEKIEHTETTNEIKYYWNKIELPTEGKITVYDILGRKILQKEGQRGINQLTELDKLADQIFIEQIEINGKTETNTLLKTTEKGKATYSQGNKPGKINNNKKTLEKITQDITYTIEFHDTTKTHYPYKVLDYEPIILGQENEYNTPLLPKGQIEIPFNNPRNGQLIDDNRKLLFYLQQVDVLQYIAYLTTIKPLKTHLNEQELPPQYNINDIRDATLEMMAETKLPIDSIYQETTTYQDPDYTTESTIGYQYLDNGAMQGYDLIIGNIINSQTLKRSYIFQFNKETIEPQYIKKFIKLGWYYGIVGDGIPVEGYFSNNGRNEVDTMLNSEKYQWRTDFQWSDNPTWISEENIPDDSGSVNMQRPGFMNEQPQSYELKFKTVNGRMQMTRSPMNQKNKTKEQTENEQMYNQMRKQLEDKNKVYK